MNFKALLSNLTGQLTQSAGAAVVNSPEVQAAMTAIQAEADKWTLYGRLAAAGAALVFVFYFLPRFENPLPRVLRGRKWR